MTGGTIVQALLLTVALILPVLALRDRPVNWDRGWRMAAIWIALFALVALIFSRMGM